MLFYEGDDGLERRSGRPRGRKDLMRGAEMDAGDAIYIYWRRRIGDGFTWHEVWDWVL